MHPRLLPQIRLGRNRNTRREERQIGRTRGRDIVPGRPPRFYETHFPYGVFADHASATSTTNPLTGATLNVDGSNPADVPTMINHPDTGLLANNLTDVMWTNGNPYQHQVVRDLAGAYETHGKGLIRQIVAPFDRSNAAGTEGFGLYFNDGRPNDLATATDVANAILPLYVNHPSVMGVNLYDDVTLIKPYGPKVVTTSIAAQRAYPDLAIGFVNLDKNTYATLGADHTMLLGYNYPCGHYANGAETLEGDFHAARWDGSTFPGAEWVDALRVRNSGLQPWVRNWVVLQGHATHPPHTATSLREPYPSEYRLQTWISIGEGINGIFWFCYHDVTTGSATSVGIGHSSRTADRAVIREMGDRLTPDIRARLVRSNKATDQFAVSGGGSTGYPVNYPTAYISTLRDKVTDAWYVVVVNRNSSAAAVTITSPTGLTGRLINLETGAKVRLGQSFTLPKFDGTIFVLDDVPGVPPTEIDFGGDVETFWANHWANPTAPYHIPEGQVKTHAREVVVAPGNLASAVAKYGSYTTYRLQSGVHPEVRFLDLEGLHFIADNPAARPTCRGIELFGSSRMVQYNGSQVAPYGFVEKILGTFSSTHIEKATIDDHYHPKRDFIFRNIDFLQAPGVLSNWEWYWIDNQWQHDHFYSHLAIWLRNVTDVLIEGCDVRGYVQSSNVSPPPALPNMTGPPDGHAGMISGNGGLTGIVMRGCTLDGATPAWATPGRTFPMSIFLDGARGTVYYDNDFVSYWNSEVLGFYTNDDLMFAPFGRVRPDVDPRNPRFNAIVSNRLPYSALIIAYQGGQGLFANNTLNTGGNNIPLFATIVSRCSRYSGDFHQGKGWAYDSTQNVFRGNTITGGNVTTFVEYDVNGGWCWTGTEGTNKNDDPNFIGRGHNGADTITGNSVSGTVGRWAKDQAGSRGSSDPIKVLSGNNKNDGTGVGI